MFLLVRILDKQSRIFSNPKMDRMNENPMLDIAGYGFLVQKYVIQVGDAMKNTLLILYGPEEHWTSATRLLAAKYGIRNYQHYFQASRKGEVNGKDYFFVSYDRAAEMLGAGELIEHTIYDGHIYGIWEKSWIIKS